MIGLLLVAVLMVEANEAVGAEYQAELLQRPEGVKLQPVHGGQVVYYIPPRQCSGILPLQSAEFCNGSLPVGFAVVSADEALTPDLEVYQQTHVIIRRTQTNGRCLPVSAWTYASVACTKGQYPASTRRSNGPLQRVPLRPAGPDDGAPLRAR